MKPKAKTISPIVFKEPVPDAKRKLVSLSKWDARIGPPIITSKIVADIIAIEAYEISACH